MSQVVINRVESDSSIELTRNSKGFGWSVKAYGSTEAEIQVKLRNLVFSVKDLIKALDDVEGLKNAK